MPPTPTTPEESQDKADAPEPQASFVPPFPWDRPLDSESLSTKRGFVFQFPPFPVLARTGEEVVHGAVPSGLYVHLPFCPYRCSYCYYAVEVGATESATDQYLTSLEKEMDLLMQRPVVRAHRVQTVFFGGGTPTALTEPQLHRVVSALGKRWDLSKVEEFTFESDPTSITLEKLQTLRGLGVNRLSIGVQSFSTEINFLNERKHSHEQTMAAISMARQAGFQNLNLDLICGLIGESFETWERSIDQLLQIAPEHVTVYLLSFRPQTTGFSRVKHKRMPLPPEEPARIEMYQHVRKRLMDRGYVQTTPNCFVREPRYEQVHQRNAWSSQPLIGLGNSAYSFIDGCVTQNYRPTTTYQRMINEGKVPVEIGNRLNARELMVRYAVLRLKQLRIDRREFLERFGFEVAEVFGPAIEQLTRLGLLETTPEQVALTERGIIYVDDVCRTFYPENVRARLAQIDGAPPTPLVKSLI